MLEWDRTYRTQGQYTLWSVLDPDRTSMKPRVVACSGWCRYIPRINVCSVHGQGLTLHRGALSLQALVVAGVRQNIGPQGYWVQPLLGSAPMKLGSLHTLISAGVI